MDTADVAFAWLFKGKKRKDVETYFNLLVAQGWVRFNKDFREHEGGLAFAGVMQKDA